VVFVEEVGKPAEEPVGLLEVSPPVPGKLVWATNRVLMLVPSNDLKPDNRIHS